MDGCITETRPDAGAETPGGFVREALAGAAAGAAATGGAAMLLAAVTAWLGAQETVFSQLGALTGGGSAAVGAALFLAGGVVVWPTVFASLVAYMPGRTDRARGMAFAAVLWTGYVTATSGGLDGLALVAYAGVTLAAHLLYGVALGSVFCRLVHRPYRLV